MCMDKHRLLGHCELSDNICMYYVYPSIMGVFTIIMIMRMITNITIVTIIIITVITNITIILYHHIAWVATTGHGSGRLVLSDVRPHNCTQSFFIEIITIVIMIIIIMISIARPHN